MIKIKALPLIAAGLFCMAGNAMAQARGIVVPDTGGVSYGLNGVNTVNHAQAGVTRRPESVQAGGVKGVNAVNMRYGGVRVRPKAIMADTPSTGLTKVSGSGILKY